MDATYRILIGLCLCLPLLGCNASDRAPVVPSLNIVPLVTTLDDGVADSQVVPIRFEGADAWLALDTGSPGTFLFSDPAGPEYVEDAGTIRIGCEPWDVPGFRDETIEVEMFRGKPIVGVLGLDFFLDVPAAIDYPGGRLVRYLDGKLPASDLKLPVLPLGGREHDRALVDVVLDGSERTLMFDTGAHDTILTDTDGEAHDIRTEVQTADGGLVDVYAGRAEIEFPGERPRTVPVLRAPVSTSATGC